MRIFSLRWTFLLAFLLLVVLTAAVSIINVLAQRQLMNQLQTVTEISAPRIIALNQVNAALLRIEQDALGIALLNTAEQGAATDATLTSIENARGSLDFWLRRYETIAPGSGERLRSVATDVAEDSLKLARMSAEGATTEEILEQQAVIAQTDDTYFFLLNSLLQTAQTDFDARQDLADETAAITTQRSIQVVAISITGAILIGLLLSFRTLRPIVRLKNIAVQIAAGQRDKRATHYPNDEIGVLAREFNNMADSLEQKIDEANAASRFKTQLLARVSHELRTPLGAVIGMAGMLKSKNLKDDDSEIVGYILKYAYELHDMVNELLEQSRWEISGKSRTVELTEIQPRDMLDDVVRKLQSRAEEQNVTLTATYDDTLPVVVRADESKMRHILNNLVTNAVKFTKEGHVTVRGYSKAPDTWAIEVTDTGIGIAPEHQTHIFEAFRQVDESNTRSYGGVGLGLSIVKQFVDLMGGDITIKSKIGEGSTFTVSLPICIEQMEKDAA